MKFLGFTLIEILIAFAIFAVVALAVTPSLLGTLRKNWLSTEADKVVIALNQAQQNSRAAIDGKQYGVLFSQANDTYQFTPDGVTKKLQHRVQIDSISEENVEFRKLTGELLLDSGASEVSIELTLGNLRSRIQVNKQGVVGNSSQ